MSVNKEPSSHQLSPPLATAPETLLGEKTQGTRGRTALGLVLLSLPLGAVCGGDECWGHTCDRVHTTPLTHSQPSPPGKTEDPSLRQLPAAVAPPAPEPLPRFPRDTPLTVSHH